MSAEDGSTSLKLKVELETTDTGEVKSVSSFVDSRATRELIDCHYAKSNRLRVLIDYPLILAGIREESKWQRAQPKATILCIDIPQDSVRNGHGRGMVKDSATEWCQIN